MKEMHQKGFKNNLFLSAQSLNGFWNLIAKKFEQKYIMR
jgi:hypothetical protein